jgi:uncharacterized protein (TIGR02996 family)
VPHDDAFIAAIADSPGEFPVRLVYADWLEERGHPGAEYLRAEVALARATGDDAAGLRRRLLEIIPRLPARWRDRFEQPDLLLAPPVPFATGWYAAGADTPTPYRSLPNLDLDQLSPDLPWLRAVDPAEGVFHAAYQHEELAAIPKVQQRASRLNLLLPPGFESFAREFQRRLAFSRAAPSFDFFLHDAAVFDFPKLGDAYLVSFFGDMDYGNPHQHTWLLYLVPDIAWHCVVAFELLGEARDPLSTYFYPEDPELIVYCAPSFQAFLYRWWLESRSDARRS